MMAVWYLPKLLCCGSAFLTLVIIAFSDTIPNRRPIRTTIIVFPITTLKVWISFTSISILVELAKALHIAEEIILLPDTFRPDLLNIFCSTVSAIDRNFPTLITIVFFWWLSYLKLSVALSVAENIFLIFELIWIFLYIIVTKIAGYSEWHKFYLTLCNRTSSLIKLSVQTSCMSSWMRSKSSGSPSSERSRL